MSERDRSMLGLVRDPRTGELVGQHPDEISEATLLALGHEPVSAYVSIRAFCVDCSGGSFAEVCKCARVTCPLWQARMGKRPKVRRRSELGAAARAARSKDR